MTLLLAISVPLASGLAFGVLGAFQSRGSRRTTR
jgi:hypothetical protein